MGNADPGRRANALALGYNPSPFSGLKTGSVSGFQPFPVSSEKDIGHDQLK